MKILVVEDEVTMVAYLRRGLTEEGYIVDVASQAGDADEALHVHGYDLVLLDVMLPGEDGFGLCRRWRKEGIGTPILFLTARDDTADRVRGLDLGGDDYLVKPFAFEELLARIRAVLRRDAGGQPSPDIHIGPLHLDTNRRRAFRDGRPLNLTMREYQLLDYLARNVDRVVSRTTLWEHLWESGLEPDSNVVDVYIRYLRNKLGRDPDLIHTVRGVGYLLSADLDPAAGGKP